MTVIEVGRLWRILIIFVVTSLSSVLLSLRLSIFAVSYALISHIHDWIELRNLVILLRGVDIYNCKSSVNE